MYNDKLYNTKTVGVGFFERYCVYCGELAKKKIVNHDNHRKEYHYCTCEGARLEIEKHEIENKLKEYEEKIRPKLNRLIYSWEYKWAKTE